ncbi:hypothetical protein JTB14_034708 [Gonioctena quinquepunctata]|nr:hypothetical protein JTB14_034708 [Gonioctena quinquepunctata]
MDEVIHNRNLATSKPDATSLSKPTSFSKSNINDFFNHIEDMHRRLGPIPAEMIWNTDKTELTPVEKPSKIIAPMLLFPRVNFEEFMVKEAPPGTIGGANPSGWSNDSLFLECLHHSNSHVEPSKEERVVLFMDNHETHLSVEAVDYVSEMRIVVVTFPPHSSNNLTVCGLLKTIFDQGVDAWLMNNPGKTFNIYNASPKI